jgi:MFS family permease
MFLAVGGALLVGLTSPITMGPFFAVIQSTVEPEMQARIFSLLSSVGTGMTPVGLIVAGPVADRVGIQAWFLLGGALCIVMAVVGLFTPAVMDIEENRSVMADPQGNAVPEPILEGSVASSAERSDVDPQRDRESNLRRRCDWRLVRARPTRM